MNRWEKIKTAALDVAQHVTQDAAQREAMADNLITLVGLMVNAVGKCVAVEGEGELSRVRGWTRPTEETPEEAAEFDDEQNRESDKAHNRYLLGELLQREADNVAKESRNADLSRYDAPAWRPRCVDCNERDGHAGDCNARCPECNRIMRFGHMFCRQDPTRPNGEGAITWAAVPRCPECSRAEGDGHAHGCRQVSTVAVHLSHDLNVCGATSDGPACDWDPDCPVHGAVGWFGL
jgi:hypothetical protein